MALDLFALDTRIAAALSELIAVRNQLLSPSDPEAPFAEQLVVRLAGLFAHDIGRRCVETLMLAEYPRSSRGYDYGTPSSQRLMDAYNDVVAPLRRIAADLLVHPLVAEYVEAHAQDASVQAVLANAPTRLVAPMIEVHRGRHELRIAGRHLLFIDDGARVIVDGVFCYGPAMPAILATAGYDVLVDGPRFLLQRQPGDGGEPLALDLRHLSVTRFQVDGVATHVSGIERIDDDGVVVRMQSGETTGRTWDEFVWRPLDRFSP